MSSARRFRSHRDAVTASLLIGFLVLLPACGGSSADSKSSGADTEAGADGALDGAASETGTDGQSSADRCEELAARWQNLVTGPATAVGGGPEDAASIRSQIEALDDEIPEPIAAAFATFATSTEKVLDVMGGYDDHSHDEGEDHAAGEAATEPAPADLDARLTEVAEISGTAEFTDALAQIDAYFAATCPPA